MRLSSLADYAVVMMSAAARHCGAARINAAQLAGETGLPLPTVQKLVSRLSSAGLLRSMRGAHGGFKLARPAAAISLADIIEAIEGPIAMTTCVDHSRDECALDHHCAVKPHWPVVNAAVRGALASVSLADLSPLPFKGRDGGGSWPKRLDAVEDISAAPEFNLMGAQTRAPTPSPSLEREGLR